MVRVKHKRQCSGRVVLSAMRIHIPSSRAHCLCPLCRQLPPDNGDIDSCLDESATANVIGFVLVVDFAFESDMPKPMLPSKIRSLTFAEPMGMDLTSTRLCHICVEICDCRTYL